MRVDDTAKSALILLFLAASLVAGLGVGAAWLSAVAEANAFNRITSGPKVTPWDAIWLDLRVQAEP